MIRVSSIAAALALALVACAGGPPTSFYTLDPVSPDGTPAASPAAPPLVVTVSLPEILDRSQLVRRAGPGQLAISPTDRWAAPLDDLVRRALAKDLALRLPGRLVTVDRPEGPPEPSILRVAIEEFSADSAGRVTLDGHWTLINGEGAVSRTNAAHVSGAASDSSAVAAVQAMSAALAQLSDQIAAGLPH